MTSRRAMPFGSGDDANRDAVAPLLSQMRAELLVMPREEVIEEHIEMMAFEEKLLTTPRFVRPRVPMPASRRAGFVVACVSATIASCGLSAAGALPEPLQHITDSIARTLGVPEPSHPTPAPHGTSRGAAGAPKASSARPAPIPTASTTKPKPAPAAKATAKPKLRPAVRHTTPTTGQKLPTPPQPIAPQPRPEPPSKRVHPNGGPKSPPKYSDNTPPGFPVDWRARAINAAAVQLRICAHADALVENRCPQSAAAAAPAQTVHWTLLNDPSGEAVAIAHTRTAPSSTAPITTVTAYERFQMDVSYTVAGDPSPHLAYSSGIAKATMTWNGAAFQHVSVTTGSVAGHLPAGLTVPSLTRPAIIADDSVLVAVQTAFADCTAATAAGTPLAGCPVLPTGAALSGDPTQGAVVAFDGNLGVFTVAASYSYTSDQGVVTVPYTATLFFDGAQLRVLDITGS